MPYNLNIAARVISFAFVFAIMNTGILYAGDANEELKKLVNSPMGCTAIKNRLRQEKIKHKDINFAFAERNDTTITGIRGCGYAWDGRSMANAKARAMKHCKDQEAKLGTDGGKKICRFVDL